MLARAQVKEAVAFIVKTDARHQGLGAVLSQEVEGQKRVISYASRRLKRTEQNMENYSSTKLKLLALKWVVTEKFRSYLLGSDFTIYTDNNPLKYLQTANLGAVEQWWVSQQESFEFTIVCRLGKSDTNDNALSCMPCNNDTETTSNDETQAIFSSKANTSSLPPLLTRVVITQSNISWWRWLTWWKVWADDRDCCIFERGNGRFEKIISCKVFTVKKKTCNTNGCKKMHAQL